MSERSGRPPGDRRGGRRPDSTIPDGPLDTHLDDMADVASLLPPLDGSPGPARRLSSLRTASMVSAIVDAASEAPPREPAAPVPLSPFDVTRSVIFEPPAEPRPRHLARRGLAMAAALVVASVGSAAAGVWIAMRERPQAAEPPHTAIAPAAEREPARRARVRTPAAAGSAPAPEPARTPSSEAPEPVPEEVEDVARDAAEEDRAGADRPRPSQRTRRRSIAQRRAEREAAREREAASRDDAQDSAPEVSREPVRREPVVVLPANAPVEDIVALANLQRKEKRWRAAEKLYERVMRDHAGTDAAAIATVASASLHLDHLADPSGALRRFLRALRLRPDGPLAEEARWGLAETHRALDDEDAERAALNRFLSAHPRSVNAARARQRLAELGARR